MERFWSKGSKNTHVPGKKVGLKRYGRKIAAVCHGFSLCFWLTSCAIEAAASGILVQWLASVAKLMSVDDDATEMTEQRGEEKKKRERGERDASGERRERVEG